MPIDNSSIPDPRITPGGVPTPATVFRRANATNGEGPPAPIPDGYIVVRTVYGKDHRFDYKDMPNGWKAAKEFLQVSTPTGFRRFPWGQILWFDTVHNSDAYQLARQAHKDWWADRRAKSEDENGSCDG